MPTTELTPLNLGSVAKGAARELFEKAIDAVVANIADTDTEPTATRGITLKFIFKPESDRRGVDITTEASTKLAGARKHSSRAFVGKGTDGKPYIFGQDPRQEMLFDPPAEDNANMLEFKAPTA